jgi:secreted PhoX family phosphatase
VARRIDARTGWLTTPAADGTSGTRGNGGPAADAELGVSGGRRGIVAAPDAAENLLIAAGAVHVVAARTGSFYGQQVTAGHVYVVAGRHRGPASLGEGGPATQAWLGSPDAIAVDPAGRLLIAEYYGQRIQAVTP